MQQKMDAQQLMKLARSPAGQQLLENLKQAGGSDMEKAVSLAASGNLDQAKQTLSGLLASPEIQALLRKLEGQL